MSETKRFPLQVLLSVTTGRLLTKGDGDDNGIGGVYQILDWMTNDSNFTHQLPRVSRECKPWLLQWFPELEPLTPDVVAFCESLGEDLPNEQRRGAIEDALTVLALRVGKEEFDVPRIPAGSHVRRNPLEELVSMRGGTEGIIVAEYAHA